jgi:hypothetical protein
MSSHRRMIRRLRRLVLGLTAIAALVPAGAAAVPTDNSGSHMRDDQAYIDQAYIDGVMSMTPEQIAGAYGTDIDPQPKVGDTPADFPGASRGPEYQAPTTTEVIRPERTIVHEASNPVPVALSSLALLIATALTGFVVVRTRGAVGRLP